MAEICFVCAGDVDDNDRLVLVRGRRELAHCSQACLRVTVRKRQAATKKARRRWALGFLALALLLVGAGTLRRHRAPPAQSISYAWPDVHPEPTPAVGPKFFGPAWPPTDQDWIFAFDAAKWTHPLPGPVRRAPKMDARIFGPEQPKSLPSLCRKPGHCGLDLGGELWGEHVYAVLDGVVDRVFSGENEQYGGQYIRLSHFGGLVFTQYFHLASPARGLRRGVHIKAGDIIGLLGDTGIKGERRHLHFALSVHPFGAFPEVYWDPTPWLTAAALRVPPRGTVAGLASAAPGTAKHPRH